MTKEEATAVIRAAVQNLSPRFKKNLAYHLEKKTPIFCGSSAAESAFFSRSGVG